MRRALGATGDGRAWLVEGQVSQLPHALGTVASPVSGTHCGGQGSLPSLNFAAPSPTSPPPHEHTHTHTPSQASRPCSLAPVSMPGVWASGYKQPCLEDAGTLIATGEGLPLFAKETRLFIVSIPKNRFLCPRSGPPCASEQSHCSDPTGLSGQCSHSLASLRLLPLLALHSFSCQAGSPSYSKETIWLPAPSPGHGVLGGSLSCRWPGH